MLILHGFLCATLLDGSVQATKPRYQPGSSSALPRKAAFSSKVNENLLLDDDDFLTEDDKKRPEILKGVICSAD